MQLSILCLCFGGIMLQKNNHLEIIGITIIVFLYWITSEINEINEKLKN